MELSNVRAVIDARGHQEECGAGQPASGSAESFGSRHDVTLELHEPVTVHGLTFGRKEVLSIHLTLDDPDAFLAELARAGTAS